MKIPPRWYHLHPSRKREGQKYTKKRTGALLSARATPPKLSAADTQHLAGHRCGKGEQILLCKGRYTRLMQSHRDKHFTMQTPPRQRAHRCPGLGVQQHPLSERLPLEKPLAASLPFHAALGFCRTAFPGRKSPGLCSCLT